MTGTTPLLLSKERAAELMGNIRSSAMNIERDTPAAVRVAAPMTITRRGAKRSDRSSTAERKEAA